MDAIFSMSSMLWETASVPNFKSRLSANPVGSDLFPSLTVTARLPAAVAFCKKAMVAKILYMSVYKEATAASFTCSTGLSDEVNLGILDDASLRTLTNLSASNALLTAGSVSIAALNSSTLLMPSVMWLAS